MEVSNYNLQVSSQTNSQEQNKVESAKKSEVTQSVSQAIEKENVKVEAEKVEPKNLGTTSEEIEKIVDTLNRSLDPFNTQLKFGVDRDDIYYVSVIDTINDRMIRRFPLAQAESLVSKMQEVAGILFDTKG